MQPSFRRVPDPPVQFVRSVLELLVYFGDDGHVLVLVQGYPPDQPLGIDAITVQLHPCPMIEDGPGPVGGESVHVLVYVYVQ